MRKRISEQNFFPDFDLYTEYRKIDHLLSEEKLVDMYNKFGRRLDNCMTLEEYIQYLCFNDWNLRGTFTSIDEMRYSLGIGKGTITPENITEEKVLDFLQYAINCVNRITSTMKKARVSLLSDDTIMIVLLENIKMLVEKLNCSIVLDAKTQEMFVVYQNSTASAVQKKFSNIEDTISEYTRIDNRHDLQRKGELLCTLYKEMESIKDKFKGTTYFNLYENTSFLFNKSGIRHWVEKDKIAEATFSKMENSELELWYDKTFDLFLSCMVVSKYLDTKKEIDIIRKSVGETDETKI